MLMLKFQKKWFSLFFGLIAFSLASEGFASSVYSCSEKQTKCIVKLDAGGVGSELSVLDDKANIIAKAKVIKKRGSYAIIELSDVSKKIRKGYPILLEEDSRSSNLEWGASFSDRDY